MTYERAAKILHPETTREALIEAEYYGGFGWEEKWRSEVEEACKVGAEALMFRNNMVQCGECEYADITLGSAKVKGYFCRGKRSPCRGRIVDAYQACEHGSRKGKSRSTKSD